MHDNHLRYYYGDQKMKIINSVCILALALANNSYAFKIKEDIDLSKRRLSVIDKYLNSIANANLEGMQDIMSNQTIVISTSAGKKNALQFFANFLPLIEKAHTQTHQRFHSLSSINRYGARFHLDYQLTNSSTGSGEYMDEFIFYDNSERLKAIYMFENLKFKKDPTK